ncbi:MAG: DEAD/DEAH box helicase [Acidobacteria bacterium]|nr:DEAD/DEAH box helicase [Acidobacteriota bacterium]
MMAAQRRGLRQGELSFSDSEPAADPIEEFAGPVESPSPDTEHGVSEPAESASAPATAGQSNSMLVVSDAGDLDPLPEGLEEWMERIGRRMSNPELHPLELAQGALQKYPGDPYVLELAAFAGLVENRPDICLRYLHRLSKRYSPAPILHFGRAIALAQKGAWGAAQALFDKQPVPRGLYGYVFPPEVPREWVHRWLTAIAKWKPVADQKQKKGASAAAQPHRPTRRPAGLQEKAWPRRSSGKSSPDIQHPDSDAPKMPPLPLAVAEIPIMFRLPDKDCYRVLDDENASGALTEYLLRLDINRLALLQDFDELICMPQLRGIDHYSYQGDTARKVLRQFRGRVLLADEVGLGKTIEAGIILKEYLVRGMVERVLVLTPPSLVGQWREEMEGKFDLRFATTHDGLLQKDPEAFWSQPRIIASIAVARRELHWQFLSRRPIDIVIVDEAHHLKNRGSKNWSLVDSIQKRFLLLLSATPIENNLIELYNVLTLLKPGIFKTEREFRSAFVSAENPRVPANPERLHGLMRDVIIRNTRALVQVRLPPRHAATVTVNPSEEEQSCYLELTRLIRRPRAEGVHPSGMHWLLEAAGSSPAAAAAALAGFVAKSPSAGWSELHGRYLRLPPAGSKIQALLNIVRQNPSEKKIVFVRFRETLRLLDSILQEQGVGFVHFDGEMPGPKKDEAINLFREQHDVLLTTESGGEGRNIQFCNTLINFDLPWNPQVIEQRIGRIHRIGQAREVFVFNLVSRNTVEEEMLRILEEKIHMFQLVVGEVQSILGNIEEEQDFSSQVFSAWIENSGEQRRAAFDALGDRLSNARERYEAAKALDEEIFGKEFGAI